VPSRLDLCDAATAAAAITAADVTPLLPLLLRYIVTLPHKQQEQEQDSDEEEPSNVASSGGAVKRRQISDGNSCTKRQHTSSAEAAAAAGSDAGGTCGSGSSSSQKQVNAGTSVAGASAPRTRSCASRQTSHKARCNGDFDDGVDNAGNKSGLQEMAAAAAARTERLQTGCWHGLYCSQDCPTAHS
jgi:hypothetical protein